MFLEVFEYKKKKKKEKLKKQKTEKEEKEEKGSEKRMKRGRTNVQKGWRRDRGTERVEIDTDEGLAAVARRSRRNAARKGDVYASWCWLLVAAGFGVGSPVGHRGVGTGGERAALSPLVTF